MLIEQENFRKSLPKRYIIRTNDWFVESIDETRPYYKGDYTISFSFCKNIKKARKFDDKLSTIMRAKEVVAMHAGGYRYKSVRITPAHYFTVRIETKTRDLSGADTYERYELSSKLGEVCRLYSPQIKNAFKFYSVDQALQAIQNCRVRYDPAHPKYNPLANNYYNLGNDFKFIIKEHR